VSTFTFRITCRFACLVTATIAIVLVAAGFLLDQEVEHGLELLHDIEARELMELIGTDPSLSAADISSRIKHDTDSDAALFVIQVARAGGAVLFRSDNLGETILPTIPRSDSHWTTALPALGRVHVSVFDLEPWRIHIGSPLGPSERLMDDYVRMCIPLLIGVALASVGLGYAFSRATLRPIRAIEATAHRIRGDRLNERIPVPTSRDELASLAVLLNQMFDRLQGSFVQIQQFTADVSHELKTPLALMRLNAEKLRARAASDPESTLAVDDILEEIAGLHSVIDRLLFLAKSESGALTLARRPVAMHELIASFAEDAQALAEDRGVQFKLGGNATGQILGDVGLLRQLLLNLMSNAVAASPPQGMIELRSEPAAVSAWHIVLTDEGTGIPAAQLSRIFERFTRVERAAGSDTPSNGHGLGLAICKSIAELHQGRIVVENRTDRSGLRVTVMLPMGATELAAGGRV
jgi:signal transduction histidine kinase